jgi:hypothetical protein
MDTGSTLLYEDAGNSLGYQRGEYATTLIRHSRTGDGTVHVRIEPREGAYPGMRATSRYEIRLELSWPPSRVTVNSESVPHRKNEGEAGWRYDGDNTRVVITTDVQNSSAGVDVVAEYPASKIDDRPDGVRGMIARLKRVMPVMNAFWPKEWSPELLINAAQTGNRISLEPSMAKEETRRMMESIPLLISQIDTLRIDPGAKKLVKNHLKE